MACRRVSWILDPSRARDVSCGITSPASASTAGRRTLDLSPARSIWGTRPKKYGAASAGETVPRSVMRALLRGHVPPTDVLTLVTLPSLTDSATRTGPGTHVDALQLPMDWNESAKSAFRNPTISRPSPHVPG